MRNLWSDGRGQNLKKLENHVKYGLLGYFLGDRNPAIHTFPDIRFILEPSLKISSSVKKSNLYIHCGRQCGGIGGQAPCRIWLVTVMVQIQAWPWLAENQAWPATRAKKIAWQVHEFFFARSSKARVGLKARIINEGFRALWATLFSKFSG